VHRRSHARGSTVYAFLRELETSPNIEPGGELNPAPPRQKQEAVSPQTVRASRARRVSRNQSAGESFSEPRSAWSAADLQTIAHQTALFFLKATRNTSTTRERRTPAQSVQ